MIIEKEEARKKNEKAGNSNTERFPAYNTENNQYRITPSQRQHMCK